jgi:hypothetical protein
MNIEMRSHTLRKRLERKYRYKVKVQFKSESESKPMDSNYKSTQNSSYTNYLERMI